MTEKLILRESSRGVAAADAYIDLLKECLLASIYDESAWRVVAGPMKGSARPSRPISYGIACLKHAIVKALARRNLQLVRVIPFNRDIRDQGLDWPCFGYTMIGRRRLDNVQSCVETVLEEDVPGDFIETGVWRGGATILMKALLQCQGEQNRTVWCADSFEGLPAPGATDLEINPMSDFSDRSYLAVSLEQVQENFRRFGLLDGRVRFLKGWFRDTLPKAPMVKLAIMRLDGDLYESTMDALNNLYDKLSPGGFVIVDDYYSWEGCRQAVTEFRDRHHIADKIIRIDAQACYWRRGS